VTWSSALILKAIYAFCLIGLQPAVNDRATVREVPRCQAGVAGMVLLPPHLLEAPPCLVLELNHQPAFYRKALAALKGVIQYPSRIKCATLAWTAFQQGLEG
jgi:hypothetical protein